MPAAKLRSHRIAEPLQELDPIDCRVAIGATRVLLQVGANLWRFEIHGVRVQVDQSTGKIVFDDLLDAWVGDRGKHAVGHAVVEIREYCSILPGYGRAYHGISNGPEQVSPCQYFADAHLHTTEVLRSCRLHRLEEEPGDKVQLHREPHTAVQGKAGDEARHREEGVDLLQVPVHEDVLPRNEHFVKNEHGIILIQTTGERVIKGATHDR